MLVKLYLRSTLLSIAFLKDLCLCKKVYKFLLPSPTNVNYSSTRQRSPRSPSLAILPPLPRNSLASSSAGSASGILAHRCASRFPGTFVPANRGASSKCPRFFRRWRRFGHSCPPLRQPIPGHLRARQSGRFLEMPSLLPPLAALRAFPPFDINSPILFLTFHRHDVIIFSVK